MKIAIDVSQIAYKGTGVAIYTSELVKHLIKLDYQNKYMLFGMSLRNKNTITSFFDEIKKLNTDIDCKLLTIPQTVANVLWNKLHVLDIDKLIGSADILHSSDWIQPPTSAKKITTVHDLVVYKYPEVSHPYIVQTQKRRLYWVKKECDMTIADSLASREDLITTLHFNPSKVQVVYPGLQEKYTRQNNKEKERVRKKYKLANDYILAVGKIEPRKNLKTTLDCFEEFLNHPLISKSGKRFELIIVGMEGWDNSIHIANDNIRMLGYIQDEDMPAFYSSACLFLYPSLYEGFGLPILEAMACGCPVVTSARGSLKELAADAALIVDPLNKKEIVDAIVSSVIDSKLRDDFIGKGLIQSKKFQWTKTANELINIYKKVYKN
ncbi:MAG: glycosyltransferase family 1 protein [Bacteroidetes bacterium]|nr:MAG: glycosyltransferase family 1 protein [Bacteroidota bacterium]